MRAEAQAAELLTAQASVIDKAVKALFLWLVLPTIGVYHVLILFLNLSPNIDVNLWVWRGKLPLSFLMLNCFIYGLLMAGTLLYWRQMDLVLLNKQLQARIAQVESERSVLRQKVDKINSAASQILVPYRLDHLVEKGLESFTNENYRPGVLQASARGLPPQQVPMH